MIHFFRQIRRNLLSENKFTKYLLYALGEILLVVIGILIALAINNGNQNRINKKNEQLYLIGLKEEFATSKTKLKELIAINRNNLMGATRILSYVMEKNELPNEIEFSELLYHTFSSDIAFNPNNSLLTEIISSGNLKNISDPDLRIQLTNWLSTLEDISRQESDLTLQREKVLDLFRTDEYSLNTIFQQAGVNKSLNLPEKHQVMSNLNLLKSTEFENKILLFISATYATENAHYDPLMEDLDFILGSIEKELN
ncbi:DUF6090 family protein [Pareuzebyella sediminis]|uniref:DUF6090 family protein n=1 Tax=Pareuzebyella sediminis TaxID=2607998 RepID=UPI001E5D1D71|nr:DUF6090 family protein [Pareuzebyella sediminis]